MVCAPCHREDPPGSEFRTVTRAALASARAAASFEVPLGHGGTLGHALRVGHVATREDGARTVLVRRSSQTGCIMRHRRAPGCSAPGRARDRRVPRESWAGRVFPISGDRVDGGGREADIVIRGDSDLSPGARRPHAEVVVSYWWTLAVRAGSRVSAIQKYRPTRDESGGSASVTIRDIVGG